MAEPDVERLAPYLAVVRAPNPGPMTLDGTNTLVVGDPALAPPVVVDPGPSDAAHLEAVRTVAGGRIGAVLLTHRHADHAEAADPLAREAGCGVRCADPGLRRGPDGLADGDELRVGGAVLVVLATPGHTRDSCCLLLRGDDDVVRLLTGDTVLGRGTTVIAEPDGNLDDYLRSLDRLQRLLDDEQVAELVPGHGPRVADPAGWLSGYRRHRQERLDQVRAALAAGARTAAEVVDRVYGDLDPAVRPAAEQSVRAQLAHLASRDVER